MNPLKSLFLLLVLSGCCSPLTVYTKYHNYNQLASNVVVTPDPLKECIDVMGESLVVEWQLPKTCGCIDDYHLDILLRLKNDREFSFEVPLEKRIGTWQWSLRGCDFLEQGRIMTYRVRLYKGKEIVATWAHPLFVELITFD